MLPHKNIPFLRRNVYIIDAFFVFISFSLPFIFDFILKFKLNEITILYVIVVCFWIIVKLFLASHNRLELTIVHLGFISLTLYNIIHFYFFSDENPYYYRFWDYLLYVILFFIYNWVLSPKKTTLSNRTIYIVLVGIVFLCLLQAILGLLQHFEILAVKHRFFKLLGTFSSPNLLAIYLAFGLMILLWFGWMKNTTLSFKRVLFLISLLFVYVIILSKSRSTWLALSGGLVVLIYTSKKGKKIFKEILLRRTIVACLVIVVVSIFSFKFLYNLKPGSVQGRVLVTKIALREIHKQPLLGYGLFSFDGEYNRAKAVYFENDKRSWNEVQHATYVFTPFNDFLLVAFDLGIPVLLVFLLLLYMLISHTTINDESRLGLSIITILGIWAIFNAPSEKIAIMSVGIFALALLNKNSQLRTRVQFDKNPTIVIKTLTFIVSISAMYVAHVKSKNIYAFKQVESLNSKEEVNKYLHLSTYNDLDYMGAIRVGQKLKRSGHNDIALNFLEKAFKKTAAPKVGKQLATLYLKKHNYKQANSIYEFNTYVEPYRFEPKTDLFRLYKKLNRYDDMNTMSSEINEMPVKIKSILVNKYKEDASKNATLYGNVKNRVPQLNGSLSVGKQFKSTILNKRLVYKIYLPPVEMINKKLPVIYINDGFSYINNGKMPQLIDSLITKGEIKPIAAVFLNPVDLNTKENIRQQLFLCNPNFLKFFTEKFMPKLQNSYPISDKREDRTILGLSFGGLAAAYMGQTGYPYFKNIAMQSPAFHPCPEIYDAYRKNERKDLNIYISYGTGDDTESQCIPFVRILRKKEYNFTLEGVLDGNHDWVLWKPQLANILKHFYRTLDN